jgi:DNA-binding ferritin-like protein (Dps family)
MFITDFISKVIGDKTQWRHYKARSKQLPPNYRTALDGLERYLMYLGGCEDGTAIFADLLDLFEQGAASRTPIRQIVGADPVEFIETFVRNYPKGEWVDRERERLTNAVQRAVQEEGRNL